MPTACTQYSQGDIYMLGRTTYTLTEAPWKESTILREEEVRRFINNLERTAGTYLYGRRIYETMMVWETAPNLAVDSPLTQDFAEIWQAANKIVYSKTLVAVNRISLSVVLSLLPTPLDPG